MKIPITYIPSTHHGFFIRNVLSRAWYLVEWQPEWYRKWEEGVNGIRH